MDDCQEGTSGILRLSAHDVLGSVGRSVEDLNAVGPLQTVHPVVLQVGLPYIHHNLTR